MPKSLLEQLPEIVARGRQQAEKILESLEGRHRVVRKKDAGMGDAENAATEWEAVEDGCLVSESFRGGVIRR